METRIIEREGGFVAQFFKFGAWVDSWGAFACRADAEREIAALTAAAKKWEERVGKKD
jgi:hypothetical protein